MQEVTRAGAASKATACENFFRTRLVKGHCNCLHDNASSRVEAMMLDQKPNTTILHRHRDKGASAERTSNGAIAVLLRGHAFRGSAHDTMETRKAAQVECSESVQRHIVEPFKRMGIRVDLYLTVYDTVEEALLHELMRPYRPHVVTITRLSAKAASQLVGLANAIHAFESAAALGGVGPYDAVVEMRLDLRLKMDFPQLLLNGGTSIGMAGSQADAMTVTWIAGVRFAWREIGVAGAPFGRLQRMSCDMPATRASTICSAWRTTCKRSAMGRSSRRTGCSMIACQTRSWHGAARSPAASALPSCSSALVDGRQEAPTTASATTWDIGCCGSFEVLSPYPFHVQQTSARPHHSVTSPISATSCRTVNSIPIRAGRHASLTQCTTYCHASCGQSGLACAPDRPTFSTTTSRSPSAARLPTRAAPTLWSIALALEQSAMTRAKWMTASSGGKAGSGTTRLDIAICHGQIQKFAT